MFFLQFVYFYFAARYSFGIAIEVALQFYIRAVICIRYSGTVKEGGAFERINLDKVITTTVIRPLDDPT